MGPKCLNNPEKGGVQKLKWPKCLIVHSSRGSGGNRARLCSARESGAHLLKDLCYREQRTNCREGPHIDIVHKKEKKLPKRQGAPDARDRGGPHIDSAQKKKKKLPKRQGASDARDGGEPHIDSMQKKKKKKKKSLLEHRGARDAKDDKRQGAPDARHGGGPHIDSMQRKKKKKKSLLEHRGARDAKDDKR